MRQNPKANLAAAYDIGIIGGGIQGAGVARDAAQRGYKVLLLEAADWGGATSSNSSKLIHGGLRYLERLEFRLVYESLRERAILLRTAPHLVKPLPFVIPFYRQARRHPWLYRLGLWLYDILAGAQPLPRHRILSRDEVRTRFPYLRQEGLLGGACYYDCQMQDARLVLENVLDAQIHGAHCHNYTPVTGVERLPSGYYQISTASTTYDCRYLVNAAGPWIDTMLECTTQRPSHLISHAKGVHLLLAPPQAQAGTRPSPTGDEQGGLLLEAAGEERIFFWLPWNGLWLIGTTDSAYQGNLRDIRVEPEDREYLLRNLSRYCAPDVLSQCKLIATYAGVRPLAYAAGKSTRDISRDYEIRQHPSGFFSLIGGKYTVYRKIAAHLLDQLPEAREACRTHILPLPGASLAPEGHDMQQLREQLLQRGVSSQSTVYLLRWYGARCQLLLPILDKQPALAKPLLAHEPWIEAEVIMATMHEQCRTMEDFCKRRTQIFYSPDQGRSCHNRIVELLGGR